ncbi:hypothetical protein, partial [Enterobacter bugandensis]|uniref:hypothetical protein n=1 Tax=Enterobacter bugandensis TaxID=881260 RepID=UPI001CC26E3A
YDNKIITAKELVYKKLLEENTPCYEENYSYYSPRINDYTKPKTLYKIQKDNSYIEINKTLYNYALHLLDNNFLDPEKANDFIEIEIKQREE